MNWMRKHLHLCNVLQQSASSPYSYILVLVNKLGGLVCYFPKTRSIKNPKIMCAIVAI